VKIQFTAPWAGRWWILDFPHDSPVDFQGVDLKFLN
jgi:hypothetical protein